MEKKIEVFIHKTPPTGIKIHLRQYEDRRMEEGEQEVQIFIKHNPSEPETFELRADAGHQILNKGQMRTLGRALIDMSEDWPKDPTAILYFEEKVDDS